MDAKGELGALCPNIFSNIIVLACFTRLTSTNDEKLVFFWDVHHAVIASISVHQIELSKLIIFKAEGLLLVLSDCTARKIGTSIWRRCFRTQVKVILFLVDPDVSASPGLAVNDCKDAVIVSFMVDGALILDDRVNFFGSSWYRRWLTFTFGNFNWLTFLNFFCRGCTAHLSCICFFLL